MLFQSLCPGPGRSTPAQHPQPAIYRTWLVSGVLLIPSLAEAGAPRGLADILVDPEFIDSCIRRDGDELVVRIDSTYAEEVKSFSGVLQANLKRVGAATSVAFETFDDSVERGCFMYTPPRTNAMNPRVILSIVMSKDMLSGKLVDADITVWRDGTCFTAKIRGPRFVRQCRASQTNSATAAAPGEQSMAAAATPERLQPPPTRAPVPRKQRKRRAHRTRPLRPDFDAPLVAPMRFGSWATPFLLHSRAHDAPIGGLAQLSLEYEGERSIWAGGSVNTAYATAYGGFASVAGHAGYSGWRFGVALGAGVARYAEDFGPWFEMRLRIGRLDRTHIRINIYDFGILDLNALFRVNRMRRPLWIGSTYQTLAVIFAGAGLLGMRLALPSKRHKHTHFVHAGAGVGYVLDFGVGPVVNLAYEIRWEARFLRRRSN